MDECEIRNIIDKTVPEAVERTLTTLGFDVSNPIEIQKDVTSLRRIRIDSENDEVKKDQFFIRELRNNISIAKKRVIQLTVGGITLAILSTIATSYL